MEAAATPEGAGRRSVVAFTRVVAATAIAVMILKIASNLVRSPTWDYPGAHPARDLAVLLTMVSLIVTNRRVKLLLVVCAGLVMTTALFLHVW